MVPPAMRALCPTCGLYHDVVRILEDHSGETTREVFDVAPLEECPSAFITEENLLEAHARFGQDPILRDGEEDDYM